MHSFDFIVALFSFVVAIAVAQVLSVAADIVIAGARVRFSWLNAGWMFTSLTATGSWWLSLWDLRAQAEWTMPTVGFLFLMLCCFYVLTRMVSPRIPAEGPVDLQAFHRAEGRKYMGFYAVLCLFTLVTNVMFAGMGAGEELAQNAAVAPMMLAAGVGAAFPARRGIQAACLGIELVAFAYYYAVLQPPLRG